MITYQPAFDPYHAAFRLIRIMKLKMDCDDLERGKLRILDFYLTFPFFIAEVKFKSSNRSFRSIGRKYENLIPFADLPERTVLFDQMDLPHRSAVDTFARMGWLDLAHNSARVEFSSKVVIPPALSSRIDAINEEQADLMTVLETFCLEYDFLGPDGLKARTGLLEYRYDPI